MRILLLALLALAVSASTAMAQKPNKARYPKMTVGCPASGETISGQSGNCLVILSWTRPRGYQATDTARIAWKTVKAGSSAVIATHRTKGTADTIAVPVPAQNDTVAGNARLCYLRGAYTPACNALMSWIVTRPPGLPPGVATTIKRLHVKPDSFMVYGKTDSSPPGTQQMCAFVEFTDGIVAMRAIEQYRTGCTTFYVNSWPASKRVVTAEQQGRANAVCIDWKVTGGTIVAEQCAATQAMPPSGS